MTKSRRQETNGKAAHHIIIYWHTYVLRGEIIVHEGIIHIQVKHSSKNKRVNVTITMPLIRGTFSVYKQYLSLKTNIYSRGRLVRTSLACFIKELPDGQSIVPILHETAPDHPII